MEITISEYVFDDWCEWNGSLDDINRYLDALKSIKEDDHPKNVFSCGICYATEEITDNKIYTYPLTEYFAKDWPKHSGTGVYPIKGGYSWDRDTEVGRLRWELLDYLIEQVENFLKDHK